ncbi:DUF1566 domain-containing protein [Chromobacterium haemolyticum]|uniref:DUF1566 domain-containing protein n=1 Tax=Chromobacterium haemolyticum TaxID=394935 RepID=UPI0002E08D58|nr:DUF1566 domain-containing protein [Chromobacterium haemolyticum]
MQQATISLTLGTATLHAPADEAARVLIEHFTRPANKPAASLPNIGEYWPGQGGVYAGLMRGQDGQPDYHLIVAAGEAGFVKEIAWGGYEKDEPAAKSAWDGKANTLALSHSDIDHPAAEWAAGLEIDGHADWYLPARREAALCYASTPELFDEGWHWTSTQASRDLAYAQYFLYGTQTNDGKRDLLRARAVRRLANSAL